MLVRKLEEKDIPGLALLYKEFWNDDSSIEKMSLLFGKLVNNENYILLCAISENQLIGSIQGIVCQELYGECRPFIVVENMIVGSLHRRKGIGALLFSEMEQYAKKNNCYQMILVTEKDRKDACGFYEKMGFNLGKHLGFKKAII